MNGTTKILIDDCEQHLLRGPNDEFAELARDDMPALIRTIRAQATEIDKLRPDAEAWRKGWAMLEELRARVIPCGHTIGDLIGGEGSVTKCGACLAEMPQRRNELAVRLKAAIRRQTIEMPGDEPNGPAEALFFALGEALKPCGDMALHWDKFAHVRELFYDFGMALVADENELREAADAYFGEDFTKP